MCIRDSRGSLWQRQHTELSDTQSQSSLANEQPVQVQPPKSAPVYVFPETVRPTKKIKKRKEQPCPMSDFEIVFLKNEREKFSLLKEQEDDDIHFLKSLLPFFKEMNAIQKLKVHSNIRNIIMEELTYPSNSSTTSSPSTTATSTPSFFPYEYQTHFDS